MNPQAALFESRYAALVGRNGSWYPRPVQAEVSEEWCEAVARVAQPPGKLLELGCGTGENLAALRAVGWTVAGVDIAPSAIAGARERLGAGGELWVSDLGAADFALEGRTYDIVLDGHCLHYMLEGRRDAFLRNARSLVSESGWFLVSTLVGPVGVEVSHYDRATRTSFLGGVAMNYWADPEEVSEELVRAGFRLEESFMQERRGVASLRAWCTPRPRNSP